jgi:hypothetical protein
LNYEADLAKSPYLVGRLDLLLPNRMKTLPQECGNIGQSNANLKDQGP